eukprot:7938866-Ditylum_brightwellii.AAC.1
MTNVYSRSYQITKVYNNGTVCVKFSKVADTYNIQNIMPYKKRGTSNLWKGFNVAQIMGQCAIPTNLCMYLGILCPMP